MDLNTIKQLYNEKTLTKAELKKREEIALAIAKEHPEMEMGKKMAIATAQAKKVAEDVESIDEISNYDLVVNYYRHLGLDPYKLRGVVGKQLRDKIKASPAFNAWLKIYQHESFDNKNKYSSLIETIKGAKKESKKKLEIKFFGYPDSKANTSNSEKDEAQTDDNFLTPN
jgi:hypothetical protein